MEIVLKYVIHIIVDSPISLYVPVIVKYSTYNILR